MREPENDFIPTRQSLLVRLKDLEDQESWREFFDLYARLIYATAIRAGLSRPEAQDVVQETIMSISKSIQRFEYDPSRGSFKKWLLGVTRWRIADQYRKRDPALEASVPYGTDRETATIDRLPDPKAIDPSEVWEEEWQRNIFDLALERVKQRVDPKNYQIYDLSVVQGWPISKIGLTLRVSAARIYMVRHRVTSLLQKEIKHLRSKLNSPLQSSES